MSNESVRVRFPPSPTGDLHVGNMRSALFNWAYARHTGGTFVFRVEDTDAARNTEESYQGLLDDMRWLGLDWDEGPEIGGPYAPYRQSERAFLYTEVAVRLLESGRAYEAFSTPEEVEARHRAAGRNPKLGYDNFDRDLTDEQKAAFRGEGRPAVLRFRVPDEEITFDDLIRGEMSFAAENVPDFALTRGDGSPLYTLTNPVDDATQHITHIVRGDDLLSSTARQLPLHRALRELGIVDAPMPRFGHLPMVMGEGNQRLSKRKTPEASLKFCRERGFLPEGLKNYLALLGWAIADDNDIFSVEEMCAAFDITDVNSSPARFDVKKCEAINATWIRRLSPEDFGNRLAEFLQGRGVVADRATVDAAVPLVQERIMVLEDAVDMLGFLFVSEEDFTIDPEAAEKQLGEGSAEILKSAVDALDPLLVWSHEQIEAALRDALIERMQLKPRKAFGPVRVATSGRTVAPPLFESLELLGRERTMRRLRAALA
jgi:glutamyl-tRNA synthetase